jgi:hypothetical protein
MSQVIEMIIAPDGSSRLETKDFAGSSCLEASRFLEDALGAKSRDERTADFYRQIEQVELQRQQGHS